MQLNPSGAAASRLISAVSGRMQTMQSLPDSSRPSPAQVMRPPALSTISRNPKAYLFAVIGAEYILQLLPKGTHDYAKFIKPSELSRWAKAVGLEIDEIIGMSYNPITKVYSLGRDTDVNYLVHTVRDA